MKGSARGRARRIGDMAIDDGAVSPMAARSFRAWMKLFNAMAARLRSSLGWTHKHQ